MQNKNELAEVGKKKQSHGKTAPGKTLLSNNDRSVAIPEKPHSTQKEIAK
jgi:hypothetical protein